MCFDRMMVILMFDWIRFDVKNLIWERNSLNWSQLKSNFITRLESKSVRLSFESSLNQVRLVLLCPNRWIIECTCLESKSISTGIGFWVRIDFILYSIVEIRCLESNADGSRNRMWKFDWCLLLELKSYFGRYMVESLCLNLIVVVPSNVTGVKVEFDCDYLESFEVEC